MKHDLLAQRAGASPSGSHRRPSWIAGILRTPGLVVATLVCAIGALVVSVPAAASAAASTPTTSPPETPASPPISVSLPPDAPTSSPFATPTTTIPRPTTAPPLPAAAPGTVRPSDAYTAFSRTQTHADGSVTAQVTGKASHYQDAAGAWRDIDTTLVANPDGSLGPKAAGPGAARLGKVAGTVAVPAGAGVITVAHPGAPAVAAATDGRTARYAGAVPGSGDIAESLTTDGFEETLTIASPGTPASYRDEFTLPAGVSARQSGEAVEFVDKAGAVVGRFAGASPATPAPPAAPRRRWRCSWWRRSARWWSWRSPSVPTGSPAGRWSRAPCWPGCFRS